jgi:predicted Co/Zn/Cd cation transporter (cation efflux family)
VRVLLVVQIWLLTAALEGFLAGHTRVALPAAIVSGVLFIGCWALYRLIHGLDRRSRR